jgi:hypothetical protein
MPVVMPFKGAKAYQSVIASEAKQSRNAAELDCFVAALLAMTPMKRV